MYEDNGDPENFNSDYEWFMDWWVMSYLSRQLEKEAKDGK